MLDYYKIKYKEGKKFEKFIINDFWGKLECFPNELHLIETKIRQRNGETEEGFEIKFDNVSISSGNLYIEYMEKKHRTDRCYVNSGILKSDNSKYWIIGNYNFVFIIKKQVLFDLYFEGNLKKVETPTSRGYLLPIEKARSICELYYILGNV